MRQGANRRLVKKVENQTVESKEIRCGRLDGMIKLQKKERERWQWEKNGLG